MWIPLVNGQQREMVPLSTWDNLGCRYIAYALEPLLVKPGFDILLTQASLAHYVGWPHQLILDVRSLQFNKQGDVVVCSPFDGAKIKVSSDQLRLLIESLKPDGVVGAITGAVGMTTGSVGWAKEPCDEPSGYCEFSGRRAHHRSELPVGTSPWEYQQPEGSSQGSFAHPTSSAPNERQLQTSSSLNKQPLHTSSTTEHFISETPLQMATKGEIFTDTATINITDPIHQTSTEVIQKNCRCEVCSLGLTKSYLFHLWFHVPGLCQRFLVQHNATVFFDCNSHQLSL
ncbi:MAG: hypothetical protein NTW08_02630 [Gammaproteobacteria bacterium]|nr:hypothetical protein [Gammaproteobacteria bacterium]